MKIFVSYTSSDKEWAQWIGWHLQQAGHEPFVHDWEISAGENIAGWMEQRFKQADRLIGVFSDAYCEAAFSQSERFAAYWKDPRGRTGFSIPIEVRRVTHWPPMVDPLKRLSIIDLDEPEASKQLINFLQPVQSPKEKPLFPGRSPTEPPSPTPFTEGGEPIGSNPPNFPAGPQGERASLGPLTSIKPPATDPSLNIRCIDDYEPKPQIFGRDGEIETIVNALLERKTIFVAGGPGMGKTAIATAAFYDPRIVAHFDRRRVFASLETATEPRAILAKLVEALGLAPTGDEVSLLRILQLKGTEQPFAAILDNAEMVFDTDRAGTERILNLVAQIDGISLLVTIRGVVPHVPNAIHIDDLSKLTEEAARDAFLAIAGDSFRDDPHLEHLLRVLDGHALSIRLVAAQAIGTSSLEGLKESWDEVHAEILRTLGEEESRLTSVRASLALSLNTNRMKATPLARRLLALLALLPDGLPESDVHLLLGQRGGVTKLRAHEAVACLHQLRLVEKRPDHRLRMLTPLRECVKSEVAPIADDKKRIVERYLLLSEKAGRIGWRDWEKYRSNVLVEADNLDAICGIAVQSNISHKYLLGALEGLAEFHSFSGRGETRSIASALARVRNKPTTLLTATCLRLSGNLAFFRSNYESASAYNKEALALYKDLKQATGEASCYRELARVASARSDDDAALAFLKKALAIFIRVNRVRGQANCIKAIGDIERHRDKLESAGAHYAEALTLYRKIGDIVGEGIAVAGSGDIARYRSELEVAIEQYETALSLSRQAGSVGNEANCIASLGDIDRVRCDYDAAYDRYEEALALYRSIGAIEGEAETMIRIGQLQLIESDVEGRTTVEAGFSLYFKLGNLQNRALAGWQAIHVALTCGDPDKARVFAAQARSCWMALERHDLVREWVDSM